MDKVNFNVNFIFHEHSDENLNKREWIYINIIFILNTTVIYYIHIHNYLLNVINRHNKNYVLTKTYLIKTNLTLSVEVIKIIQIS